MELADHFHHLRRYSEASEHLPTKCAVDRVVCLLQFRIFLEITATLDWHVVHFIYLFIT